MEAKKNKKDPRQYIYKIDANNIITFVNDDWLAFAQENDAPHLTREATLQKSLLEYISDQETRDLYNQILDTVRATKEKITIPLRCDSPEYRRFIELKMSPKDKGAVELIGHVKKMERRNRVALLEKGSKKSDEFIRTCSWCKKVLVPNEGWFEIEEAIKRLKLMESTVVPKLTHGMCPSCYDKIIQQLKKVKKTKHK
jgi:hypothetical protein